MAQGEVCSPPNAPSAMPDTQPLEATQPVGPSTQDLGSQPQQAGGTNMLNAQKRRNSAVIDLSQAEDDVGEEQTVVPGRPSRRRRLSFGGSNAGVLHLISQHDT